MQEIKFLIVLSIIFLASLKISAQHSDTLIQHYTPEDSVRQNKSLFKFWRGNNNNSKSRIVITRLKNKRQKIIFNERVRDGTYQVKDVNYDGYKDFVLYYHDFDVIHFFEPKINNFNFINDPIQMPLNNGVIDSVKHIYWGYRDSQYAENYDYSILYTYIKNVPYFHCKIIYKTAEGHDERSATLKIELYRFANGDYDKPIFVREVKTKNPATFDFLTYWQQHYKALLGYR